MPSCEKCWADAQVQSGPYFEAGDYYKLVAQRDAEGKNCTPEQQAGPNDSECKFCRRMTLHQHCNVCMNPDCQSKKEKSNENQEDNP